MGYTFSASNVMQSPHACQNIQFRNTNSTIHYTVQFKDAFIFFLFSTPPRRKSFVHGSSEKEMQLMKQFYRWKQSREWSRECEPKTDLTKNNSQWQENATTNGIPHDTPAIVSLSPIQNPGMHKKAEDNLLASKNWDNVKLHISKEKMQASSDTARTGQWHKSSVQRGQFTWMPS